MTCGARVLIIPVSAISSGMCAIRSAWHSHSAVWSVVIHAGALKQVSACEYSPFEAIQTNIMGGRNVIDVQRRIPKHMVPTQVRFLEELPRNANGKVNRKALIAMLSESSA